MTAARRTSTRSRVKTDLATSRESLNRISNSRYLFFGGKGGVGKTTAASATAFHLLDRARTDVSILLFSTDPAHSLADSLGKAVGNKLTEVAKSKKARIIAFEMDAGLALENFRNQHGPVMAEIAERGTFLDESDIREVYSLLRDTAVASRANKPIGDRMIMNAAFLIERDRENEFDQKVKEIASKYEGKLSFKYTGPWPPYNFVHIRLKLERGEGTSEAVAS